MENELKVTETRTRPGQSPRTAKWAAALSILVTLVTAVGTIVFDFLSGSEIVEGTALLVLSIAYFYFGVRLIYADWLALRILPILVVVHFIFELSNVFSGDMVSTVLACVDCIVVTLVLLPASRHWCMRK